MSSPALRFADSPRACRIVCTLGPSSASPEVIDALIESGMDIARLNFSHGSHESHAATLERVRSGAQRLGRAVAVLQDLQGHKIRVGKVATGDSVELVEGAELVVGAGSEISPDRIGLDFPNFARHVRPGDRLYLDDGQIEIVTLSVAARELRCRVLTGGRLRSRKGVILPDTRLEFPLINEKDLRDARFGADHGVDMIAMSFVRSAVELRELRCYLSSWGRDDVVLIAKIEDREGVDNIDAILEAADGVLIARGDLGVTLPREQVPGLQKAILRKANACAVPAITATQMLESMTTRDKPTRAEVNDVYCAVLDGSDAVMLSGETASGAYPVESVREMDRICRAAEHELRASTLPYRSPVGDRPELHDRIAASAATFAENMAARCILAFSLTGRTLRALSASRPHAPVYGVVGDEAVLRRLLIHRGLSMVTMERDERLDPIVSAGLERLRRDGVTEPRDRVVIVASEPEPGTSETYRLELAILA